MNKGRFIAFIGMMGTGKSTLTLALARKLNAKAYIEPDESHWPIDPEKPWEASVTALENWVRLTNLENFKYAVSDARAGNIAVADGGLFLINRELIYADCCGWYFDLMPAADRAKLWQDAKDDWRCAPCPDVLVLLRASRDIWLRLLALRGRSMDGNAAMIERYDAQQALIAESARMLANERGVDLVEFENDLSGLDAQIEQLLVVLS